MSLDGRGLRPVTIYIPRSSQIAVVPLGANMDMKDIGGFQNEADELSRAVVAEG